MKNLWLIGASLLITACELPTPNTSESTPTTEQTQPQTEQSQTAQYSGNMKAISTGGQTFDLEVAQDQASREKGLMNRESLAPNTGMLFIFENPDNHGFWMKNTLIPLDIIWLSKNQQVLHFVQAQPCTTQNCTIYRPANGTQAHYVIELNAGTFEGQIGDFINF